MKITRIRLQSFRAFDEPFELDLEGGKNLLLHGENGSGKSSIYQALKYFFEERGDDIIRHRNHFSTDDRDSYVRIRIQGRDAAGVDHDDDFHWDVRDGHPLPVPKDPGTAPISPELRSLLVDGARRSGFIDYRALLRTHLLTAVWSRSNQGPEVHNLIYGIESQGLEAQLFDLVAFVVLAGVRVSIAGGRESMLGSLARQVWHRKPLYRYSTDMRNARTYTETFNQAFNAILSDLDVRIAEFLDYFEHHHLSLNFHPVSLQWDKDTLMLHGAELVPDVEFCGKQIARYHTFLNEARLSALAMCLFLAGVRLSDNDYDNAAHPRFLVLDDALIGLELQNRLPILRILTSDAFKNYQIFLLTHDRVWFDLARGHLREMDGWLHKELRANEAEGHRVPSHQPAQIDLVRARNHLANGDLKAAAVYARSAFEWKLRKVCEKHGIKVPFKEDADRVGAGMLWQGIVERQRKREKDRVNGATNIPDFISRELEEAVETMRSTVLNRLSHSGASGSVRTEVESAIATVESVHSHSFPKIKGDKSEELISLER